MGRHENEVGLFDRGGDAQGRRSTIKSSGGECGWKRTKLFVCQRPADAKTALPCLVPA